MTVIFNVDTLQHNLEWQTNISFLKELHLIFQHWMTCFLKWIQNDDLRNMLFVESVEMTGMFVMYSCKFVLLGHYVTTNLSSVVCSPYTETVSEAHICISLPHDTPRGTVISISLMSCMGYVWADGRLSETPFCSPNRAHLYSSSIQETSIINTGTTQMKEHPKFPVVAIIFDVRVAEAHGSGK